MYANRRRVMGALIAVFATPRLAGCTGKEKPKMTSITVELPGLTIQMSEERSADRIALSYVVTNTGNQTLFLLDGIHDRMGEKGVLEMRDAPWVVVDGGNAVLSARYMDPPPGVFVNTLNYPLPTRIAQRETSRRSFAVALPLLPVTPYRSFRSPPRPEIQMMPMTFELGYFFGRPGIEQMAKTVNTSEGPRPAFDTVSEEGQSIARLGPFGNVPVVVNAVRA